MKKILHLPVYATPKRVDQALTEVLSHYSRSQIQAWIAAGYLRVNGMVAKAKLKVSGGEHIELTIEQRAEPAWQAQAIPLAIAYEDEQLLIVNKPIGLVVHPGAGNADCTLVNALLHYFPGAKLLPRAGILHRLDKNTSGLLVVAKTEKALKSLSEQLKARSIVREYQALVTGILTSGGTIEQPIGRHPIHRKKMAVTVTGKHAITHYSIMERYRLHTRIKVRLETGRTHQIRAHMAHIHHPLLGDVTYGARPRIHKAMTPELVTALRTSNHQALHAFALGFIHPQSHEPMRIEVKLPDTMQQLIRLLRNDSQKEI